MCKYQGFETGARANEQGIFVGAKAATEALFKIQMEPEPDSAPTPTFF